MELQLSVAGIDAATRLLSSQYQAERRLLTAQMAANATLLAGAAQTKAIALQLEAEASSLLQTRAALRSEVVHTPTLGVGHTAHLTCLGALLHHLPPTLPAYLNLTCHQDANELLGVMWLLGVRRRNRQSPTQLLVQMTPPDVFSRRVGQPASAQ